jgi:RNA polymerase sigma-70 factor, ECF subfamily
MTRDEGCVSVVIRKGLAIETESYTFSPGQGGGRHVHDHLHDEPDEGLLTLHVAGHADAFGELVRRHRDRLWAVALRTLGDREEAADAVQDALVSAYRAAHTFRGQSAVTTWLHRITVNACLDRARKAASRKTSPVNETERLEQLLEPHESAAAPAERNDLHRELLKALHTLPADQRAALVLVDMQGYPVAEAARILDVPTGTVKSRCARGRARLLPLLTHLRAGAESRGESKTPGKARNRTPETSVPPAAEPKDPDAVKGGGGHA